MVLPGSGRERGFGLPLSRGGALAAILAVAAAFRLPGLGNPATEIFDEVYHAKTALQYLDGAPPTEWVHPPMAKLLIAVGVRAFGYKPWAWRLAPALAGIALAPVFLLLARRILRTERAALLASALLLADGVYLVQSRTAMTNIFAVLFQVTAALLVVAAALHEGEALPAATTLSAGIALGLALATRWTSLWAWVFLALVLAAARGRRLLRLRDLALVFLAFAVLPVVLYALSYWPLRQWTPFMESRHTLSHLLDVQKAIWAYHAHLQAQHPYFSKWYTWPWLYRPTWYYFTSTPDTVWGIVAIGNPALWWASVPATLWAIVTGTREGDRRLLFSGLGFCALYLPWGISPRTLNYSHYLFEAIPYACLSLGVLLDRLWDGPGARKYAAWAYLGLVICLFLFFLPFLVALPVPAKLYFTPIIDDVKLWTWFPTWI